jgi:competence protein ComEA
LAAPVSDGEQILIPRRGEAALPAATPTAAATSAIMPVPGASASLPGGLVNVNTADAAQLETLPGIGPVLAQQIIDYRTQNGPFATVDSLLDVSGIGPATLDEIRALVTV